jgi:hypothetical protein
VQIQLVLDRNLMHGIAAVAGADPSREAG